MFNALVSVIVPVYNGEQYLEKTVDSILIQDYENIELILIDDGSRDNSAELIKKLAQKDNRIKPFYNKNGGVAFARNFGIAQASADFIAFCDQDDLWLPTKLSRQIPLFERAEVGLVYCGSIADYILYNKQVKHTLKNKSRGIFFAELVQANFITCCTVVVRKSFLEQVGGFDDDRVLMGVDDWHLWLKLAMICECDYVEDHLAIHVFHGDNYSSNDQKMHAAEIVCLDKIADIAKAYQQTADWSIIKQKLHVRYAHSYIHSGLYQLAGETLIRAHQEKPNIKLYIKGLVFKLFPRYFWALLQSTKRKMDNK